MLVPQFFNLNNPVFYQLTILKKYIKYKFYDSTKSLGSIYTVVLSKLQVKIQPDRFTINQRVKNTVWQKASGIKKGSMFVLRWIAFLNFLKEVWLINSFDNSLYPTDFFCLISLFSMDLNKSCCCWISSATFEKICIFVNGNCWFKVESIPISKFKRSKKW